MNKIIKILMQRDSMSELAALELFEEAKADLDERLAEGEMPYDICQEWFGLEPDYLDYLL